MAGASKSSSSSSKAGGSGGGGGGVAVAAVAPPRVAEVAEEAHRVGRQRLAMMLLEEFETAPSEQVCVCVCALLCCVVCYVPLLHACACLPLLLCMRAFRCVMCVLGAPYLTLSPPPSPPSPPSPSQVPLLLQMNELPTALTRAITSSDVELIHLVLLHGRSSLADPGTYTQQGRST